MIEENINKSRYKLDILNNNGDDSKGNNAYSIKYLEKYSSKESKVFPNSNQHVYK